MKKIWLIAAATFRQRVTSATFLILTLAVPVLSVIAGAFSILTGMGGETQQMLGYVDETGQLAPVETVQAEDRVIQFNAYESQEQAREAYQEGEVGAFLVVPAGYFQGEQPQYYGSDSPNEEVTQALQTFMRQAMLPDAPDWVFARLEDPSQRTFVALGSGETVQEGPALILRIVLPIALALFLAFALLFTSSQMGAAVVREKDRRAMEMVITSLRPIQLVAGKVLGIGMLSLTQFAVWGISAVVGVGFLLAGEVTLAELSLPWRVLLWAALLGVPGYFLYAVVAAGIGIIAGDTQQAQQLAGFLGFFGLVPMWFIGILIESPEGPLSVGLSLFPFTGPIVSLIRMSFVEVPFWQLAAGFSILVVSLLVAVWLVARIFRAAMLLYGKGFHLGELARSFRQV